MPHLSQVATVLTACGIETVSLKSFQWLAKLQQYLPLAVLKPSKGLLIVMPILYVATVLTACGIETRLVIF